MSNLEEFFSEVLEVYKDRILDVVDLEPDPFETIDYKFPEDVKKRLEKAGITQLFSHQSEAINRIANKENVCVVSPTASGKSLIYYLPALFETLAEQKSTFLMIFPTKALAQDQLRTALELIPEGSPAVYDGDTPLSLRKYIRAHAKMVFTNPDMIHYGILPNHHLWADFLRNLRFIVIDEAHVLRGVFGSNASFVFRRLIRIAEHYGASPQVIITSATIGNPEELSKALTGKDFTIIKSDRLSSFRKRFVFWNPPFDEARNRRISSNIDSTALFVSALKKGIRTIVFSKSKQTAEFIARRAKEMLPLSLKNKVAAYRAGYLPEVRRKIERDLFEGRLTGISATRALELGIDIGDLSVAIINRYPGTVSSFMQQAGRAGRRTPSIVFFIAGDDPLDQHYVRKTSDLIKMPHEKAIIDLSNKYIASKHILAAAFEKPVEIDDFGRYFVPELIEIAEDLSHSGYLRKRGEKLFISPQVRRIHSGISIRSPSEKAFQIIDSESGELIGTLEEQLAYLYLHPGAVYLHETQNYLVLDLDVEKKVAFVEKNEAINYYTVALVDTNVEVLEKKDEKEFQSLNVFFGNLRVTNHVFSFKKIHNLTESVLGYEFLDLPPSEFETEGFWFEFNSEIIAKKFKGEDIQGGIHGIEHAHIALLPLFAGCDRWDIGGMSTPVYYETGKTTIFIYDGYQGGIGYAEKGFEIFEDHIASTYETIKNCPCRNGCPSCIVSPKCGNENRPLDKKTALELLKEHLGVI